MNMMNMQHLHYLEQNLNRITALILTGAIILFTAGCDVEDGTVKNEVQLPTDSTLNFYCEDEGIYLEDCVLNDPANPYAKVNVTNETKFALNDDAPSAKSRFYLWATAMAKSPSGENQYYTALSLQELYAESGSPTTQEQAKKAYRSVLDNYFLSATFYVIIVDEQEVAFADALKDLTGENLYDPTAPTLVSLYTDPIFALEDMSAWGYIYDTTNKTVTKYR